MANFINIDGTLINLDKIVSVGIGEDGRINFNTGETLEDFASFPADHKQAKRAYEWLKNECLASFENVAYYAVEKPYHSS